jgi:hypothetical protein
MHCALSAYVENVYFVVTELSRLPPIRCLFHETPCGKTSQAAALEGCQQLLVPRSLSADPVQPDRVARVAVQRKVGEDLAHHGAKLETVPGARGAQHHL